MVELKTKKLLAVLLSFVMVFGLVSPAMAYNQGEESSQELQQSDFEGILENMQGDTEELSEEELEKLREENPQLHEEKFSETMDSQGLPSIIDWKDPEYNEEDFLFDGKLEKQVYEEINEKGSADVILRMAERPDMEALYREVADITDRGERGAAVIDYLRGFAVQTQQEIDPFMAELESAGYISNLEAYWIFNGYSASITEEAIELLVERNEIGRITLDKVLEVPDIQIHGSEPQLPEWGLEKVFATDVWGEYGIYGEGIVVGIMDTGVQMDHEALQHNYRGRDGNHESSWLDTTDHDYSTPTDGHGHGTHVAGSAVGGGEGRPIGVAPRAEWIAAKIFSDGGGATTSGIHEAFEWFLAPGGDPEMAPHVVNNSWGNADTYNTEFYEGVQAWVAAGIFPLFAAGNSGPGSETIGSPASFPDSFAVGATDINDQLASFSSRGPVFWPDEDGNMVFHQKPEVSAPGHEILSAWPASRGDGDYISISGTSMAAPHVAGVIALILEANPELTIDEIKELLETTAREEHHMGELPNDLYGHGIVNAYRAVTATAYAGYVTGVLNDQEGNPISGEILIPEENIHVQVPDSGEFDFIIREGQYEVEVRSFGYHTSIETLEVERNEAVEVEWTLEEAERFTLTGNITDEEGNPVPYAYIRVSGVPINTARTTVDGSFVITGVPQETYDITVSGEGFRSKHIEVEMDQDRHLDLEVEELIFSSSDQWFTANNNIHRNAVTNHGIDESALEEEWYFDAPGNIVFASPAVEEGVVVVTTDNGNVVAADQYTGEMLWSISTGRTNRSTPTIVDGVVYVAGGENRNIHALDLQSGMTLWTYQVDYPAIYESPLYHEGILYISSSWQDDAELIALDAETGEEEWRSVVGDGVVFGASIGENRLYVGTFEGRELKALSLEDGNEIWSVEHHQGFASRPVYDNGVVYAASTDFANGSLLAVDDETGEVLWEVDNIGDSQAVSPIVYDDLVIMGSASVSALRAFDRASGDEVWNTSQISTMLNTGAVSGNGILFVVDNFRSLHAIDVYTGEVLEQLPISAISTSGVAIDAGQVIVADQSGITSFTAPGTLYGQILDGNDNPLSGVVTLMEKGQEAFADEDGNFSLDAIPGDYRLRVEKYGFIQEYLDVEFSSGYSSYREFVLNEGEDGSLTGTVVDARTGLPLEGVTITLENTPLESITDEFGEFHFNEVTEGTYTVESILGGYVDQRDEVTITAGEETEMNISMAPYDVAVLNDYESEITNFLTNHGIPTEERDWDVIDDIHRYEVIYLNGAYGSGGWRPDEELLIELFDAAEEEDVNLIFADQWGPSYGSLRPLVEMFGDPASYGSHYWGNDPVHIEVDHEHPIFGDWEEGQRVTVLRGDFAWFNRYSGRNIGSTGNASMGMVGTGVAYKAVSEDSAHLLLSSHAANPWQSPTNGWMQPQQQILLNGIEFLMEAQYGKLDGNVQDPDGNPISASVEVEETGVRVQAESDGTFELFHDEGSYEVVFRATGYGTQRHTVDFQKGEPVSLNVEMPISDSGTISGYVFDEITDQVIPDVEIRLYNDEEELVADAVASGSGYYEITGLDEAIYTVVAELRGYVIEEREVEVTLNTPPIDFYLWPAPNVAILGDTFSADIGGTLENYGMETSSYRGGTTRNVLDTIENYDLVYFNEASSFNLNNDEIAELFSLADEHRVSIIVADNRWGSNGGMNRVTQWRNDPAVREAYTASETPIVYEVLEENMIFSDMEPGETIPILVPGGGRHGAFEDYSGYPLANIGYEGEGEPSGLGFAYSPRTDGSMELLTGGHGVSLLAGIDDFTDEGLEIFKTAALFATHTEFPMVRGTVTDADQNGILAELEIEDTGQIIETDEETGYFQFASVEGDYTLNITSYGYVSETHTLSVEWDMEELHYELAVDERVGSLEGIITDEDNFEGVEAQVRVEGYPRETESDNTGHYELDRLMPGSYTLIAESDGYVMKELNFDIHEGETTELNFEMKPSPTIGIIVDNQSSSGVTLAEYLGERGWNTIDLFYTDLDQLDEIDLIFANSDYNNDLIPSEEEFIEFTKAIDAHEIPVVWTGDHGGRGSIRYLIDYLGDPEEEIRGSRAGTLTGGLLAEHPILEGIEEDFDFSEDRNNYYAFDGYTGHTIVDVTHSDEDLGHLGDMIAYAGRTINSEEVLLANFTIGHSLHPEANFTEYHEMILNNTLMWLLENEEAHVGELRGHIVNDLDQEVFSTVTVEETGYTFETERDGSFFLALDDGEYTLQMDAFGHEEKEFTVTFERGVVKEESFELTADPSGTIRGVVEADDTGEALEGAIIEVVGTPLETVTDENGEYAVNVPVGTYNLRFTAPGYSPMVIEDITVGFEDVITQDVSMSIAEDIAVLDSGTHGTNLAEFLRDAGYEVDQLGHNTEAVEELIEDIDKYALIIINNLFGSVSDELFEELIDTADDHAVSMIFPSQWGSDVLTRLSNLYGDPESVDHGFVPEYIQYRVLEDHPIFAGYEVGQEIIIAEDDRGGNQQYGVFSGYSGTTISEVTDRDGETIGGGIAYDFRTANNVHVLLGSLRAGTYGTPGVEWTEDTEQIYINAVDWAMRASLGEIIGTVTNEDGEPIQGAKVEVPEENLATETNSQGEYSIGIGLGVHDVEVSAIGYVSQTKSIEVEELGELVVLDFELEATDRSVLTGKVYNVSTEEGIEGAEITLVNLDTDDEYEDITNESGEYHFDDLLAGDYEISVAMTGYRDLVREVTLEEGEEVVEDFGLSAFDTAVLGDNGNQITDFLMENEFAAEARDWSITEDVYNYDLIVVNTSEGTTEQISTLIEKADEFETSLVFVDTWGVAEGSIPLLNKATGAPERVQHGYDQGSVYLTPVDDHAVFEGFDSEQPIRVHSERSPYSSFKGYEGIVLSNLTVDEEDLGNSIAYDFRSENHMHLLLSSFAVNNMIGPNTGWTHEGQQVYLQALEWAKTAEQQLPSEPAWPEEEMVFVEEEITLTGHAEYRTEVTILVDGEEAVTVETDADNTFTADLTLPEGNQYEITAVSSNYAGETAGEVMTVTVVTPPSIDQPEDQKHTDRDAIVVSGEVMIDGLVTVYNNGEPVAGEETFENSYETTLKLEEGENLITVTLTLDEGTTRQSDPVAVHRDTGEPLMTNIEPAEDLYVKPGDEVVVAFNSNKAGGQAEFKVTIPGIQQQARENNMEEVEPGYYEGTWTVPAGVHLEGAVISISHEDAAGNRVTAEAPGRLTILDDQVDRLYGDNRFETAATISQEGWNEADVVVLTRSHEYADALAGAPLAHMYDAPMLLTHTDRLVESTMDEIQRLGAEKVIILGGPAAISEDVENELADLGLEIERIAGSNRFETAAMIAHRVAPEGMEEAVVVNGRSFPDALSAAPYAAKHGMPILLVEEDSYPAITEDALNELGVERTLVIGGPAAVSEEVAEQLPEANRLSGDNRYATGVAVAQYFEPDTTVIYAATGLDFADALTGSVLAAKENRGILLIGNRVHDSVEEYISSSDAVRVTIFGGTAAVDNELVYELNRILDR